MKDIEQQINKNKIIKILIPSKQKSSSITSQPSPEPQLSSAAHLLRQSLAVADHLCVFAVGILRQGKSLLASQLQRVSLVLHLSPHGLELRPLLRCQLLLLHQTHGLLGPSLHQPRRLENIHDVVDPPAQAVRAECSAGEGSHLPEQYFVDLLEAGRLLLLDDVEDHLGETAQRHIRVPVGGGGLWGVERSSRKSSASGSNGRRNHTGSGVIAPFSNTLSALLAIAWAAAWVFHRERVSCIGDGSLPHWPCGLNFLTPLQPNRASSQLASTLTTLLLGLFRLFSKGEAA